MKHQSIFSKPFKNLFFWVENSILDFDEFIEVCPEIRTGRDWYKLKIASSTTKIILGFHPHSYLLFFLVCLS